MAKHHSIRFWMACFAFLAFTVTVAATDCEARWVLYDDFESGVFDPELWALDDSSAVITIEDGRAKFEHMSGYANDSAWLIFVKRPEKIKAIKATIRMQSGVDDLRARIAGFLGNNQAGDLLWNHLNIRANRDYFDAGIWNEVTQKDLHWQLMGESIQPTGKSYILEISFTPMAVSYTVQEVTKTFILPQQPISAPAPEDVFKAIGTRSNSGEGSGTVYIDNVWVKY